MCSVKHTPAGSDLEARTAMFLGFREPLKLLQIVLFVWVVWVLVGVLCVFCFP